MNDCFLHINEYAKMQVIEIIMTTVGRRIQRARQYREDLNAMTLEEVRRERELIGKELKGEL